MRKAYEFITLLRAYGQQLAEQGGVEAVAGEGLQDARLVVLPQGPWRPTLDVAQAMQLKFMWEWQQSVFHPDGRRKLTHTAEATWLQGHCDAYFPETPPPLPFPSTLLLCDEWAVKADHGTSGQVFRKTFQAAQDPWAVENPFNPASDWLKVLAWLCLEGGKWFAVYFYGADNSGSVAHVSMTPCYWRDGVCAAKVMLSPWFPAFVLAAIAAKTSTTLVEQAWELADIRSAHRWDRTKKAAPWRHGAGRMPPPYYRLDIKDVLRVERSGSASPQSSVRADPAYCFDVRSHERCRILSGPLPLEAETLNSTARMTRWPGASASTAGMSP